MAANKFATMLHRNAHRLTVVLVYAVLEWILIILLLLNSLFSYLITKFANFFGLKTPCPWCSRVDHVLEPGNNTSSYRDLVCETHAAEISKLSYCSNHRRLAETQSMCVDCLASRPNHNDHEPTGMTRRIAFISWLSKNTLENGEKNLRCSCCKESLSSDLYPPYLLFKHSWGALKYTQKGNLIMEAIDDDNTGSECKELSKPESLSHYTEDSNEIERNDGEENHDHEEAADEHQMLSDVGSFGLKDAPEEDCSRSESNLQYDGRQANEDQKAGSTTTAEQESYDVDFIHQSFDDNTIQCCFGEDDSLKIINMLLERTVDCELNRLIPVELIDSSTTANQGSCNLKEEDLGKQDHQSETFGSASLIEAQVSLLGEEALLSDENKEMTAYAEVERMETDVEDGEKSSVLNLEGEKIDLGGKACKQVLSMQAAQTSSGCENNVELAEMKEADDLPAQEEELDDLKLLVDERKSNAFTELSDHATNQPGALESTPPFPCQQEDQSFMSGNGTEISNASETCMTHSEPGSNCGEKITVQENMISDKKNQEGANHHLSIHLEPNEAEEEKFPETPTSVDSVHYVHKKLLLFEKRESGTEESLDGSVISETDSGDPVLTVERLKTALKVERKALNSLYAELEEERSASAIAANQTMAMINRLQEEKAAMQMEALQYQRMMEEQSEYDQEALQLLNELMVKREKEKQELEKELEVYRKKVLDYEAKEKMRMMKRIKDGSVRSRNSSATCSNAADIDELSIDLNREAREEDGSNYGNQESSNDDTPGDDVINLQEIALDCVKQMSALDDSLAEFEEERLSILDQLKALEEKLLNLGDNEFTEDTNLVEHSSNYSGKGFNESYELSTPEENGVSNGLSKDYPVRKTMGSMAKSLLPLLDAADSETEEGLKFAENVESDFVEMENSSISKFESDGKRIALEEEVDHVYERLQALEADREFLKHCMSSIKKGDKGMDLLQEILQHLRDLRAVELRVRNMTDDPLE